MDNPETLTTYANRTKITLARRSNGKVTWEISYAGEETKDVLAEVDKIDQMLRKRYWGEVE